MLGAPAAGGGEAASAVASAVAAAAAGEATADAVAEAAAHAPGDSTADATADPAEGAAADSAATPHAKWAEFTIDLVRAYAHHAAHPDDNSCPSALDSVQVLKTKYPIYAQSHGMRPPKPGHYFETRVNCLRQAAREIKRAAADAGIIALPTDMLPAGPPNAPSIAALVNTPAVKAELSKLGVTEADGVALVTNMLRVSWPKGTRRAKDSRAATTGAAASEPAAPKRARPTQAAAFSSSASDGSSPRDEAAALPPPAADLVTIAVRGLNALVEEQGREMKRLAAQVRSLSTQVQHLESRVAAFETANDDAGGDSEQPDDDDDFVE